MRISTDRQRLRVAFVATSMYVGGQERVTVDLVNGLDRERFEPALLLTKDRGPLLDFVRDDVKVDWGFRRGPLGPLLALPRIQSWLRRWKADCVFTVGLGDKLFLGRIAARLANVPVILSGLHSTPGPEHLGRSVVGRWNRHLMFLNSGVVTVSEDMRDYLIQHDGYPAARCRVLANGVDTEKFRPRPPSAEICAELGVQPDTPVASIVATLRPEKRHDLFLQAAQVVAEQLPETQFLIIGGGPLRAEYESLAEKLGIRERVHFLGSRNDIPDLLALSDVVCLASTDVESAPICMLEAMATGRAQVAPAIGGVPKIIEDGVTGLLVPPGDGKALGEAIYRVLADKALSNRLGEASRARALDRFSLEAMVQSYEDLIEEYCHAEGSGQSP